MTIKMISGTNKIGLIVGVLIGTLVILLSMSEANPLKREYSIDELVADLKKAPNLDPLIVENMLSRVDKKDDVIVGASSTNDLLSLSSISNLNLCTKDEIDRRKEICADLKDTIDNLFTFCEVKLSELIRVCKMNALSVFELSFKDIQYIQVKMIKEFASEIKNQHNFEEGDKKLSYRIQTAIKNKENAEKTLLKAACQKLIPELERRKIFLKDDLFGEHYIMRSCEEIGMLSN